jgi:lysophospholipase L1-like esterase
MNPKTFSQRRVLAVSLAWLSAALFTLSACSDETTPGDGTATGGATTGGASGSSATGGAGSANGGGSGVGGAGSAGLGTGGSAQGGGATGGASGAGASAGAGGGPGGAGSGGASGASGDAGAAGTPAGGAGTGSGGRGGAGAGGRGGNAGAAGGGAGGRGGAAGGGASGAGGTGGAGGGSSYQPCPATGACKIMPFGDSITEGYPNYGGYRIELFRLAHQAGKDITFVGSLKNGPSMVDGVTFPSSHEGHGGYTISGGNGSNGIAQFVQPSLTNYTPHIITLMIGTNDLNGNIDVANAPTRLGALLDSIYMRNADVLVILAQIVPSQSDSLNQRVQTYNAAMPALVTSQTNRGRHIVLIDMYAAFTRDANYKTALLGDNLHPNQAGYARMGQTWYATLSSYLR